MEQSRTRQMTADLATVYRQRGLKPFCEIDNSTNAHALRGKLTSTYRDGTEQAGRNQNELFIRLVIIQSKLLA